ncbi:MAG: hypothetical protein PF904_06840 [Kiritimatiellae bacterium]|jgi:hypothetical protein|nr:hypothetical protein [Kiritimatiellia bacterium]
MAQEWNIRHRGHECSICGCKFKDKQKCVSLLREVDRSYERMDCCVGCWDALERDWEPFSLWDGVYCAPKPVELKKEPVRKDTAEILLRKLIDLEDPAMLNVVYVLAVMLERGKQLIERDTKPHESGGILRIYEDKRSGDTFVVLDPKLRLDKLAIVQQQVVALLSGTQTLGEEKREEVSVDSDQEPVGSEEASGDSEQKAEDSVSLEVES